MTCRKYRDWLVFYVEDELPSAQRFELEAHVGDCSKCARELDDFKNLKLRLKGLGERAFLAGVHSRLARQHPQGKTLRKPRRFEIDHKGKLPEQETLPEQE